jgi:hypothetical protein
MSAALLARLIEAGTPADLVGEVAMELARAQALQEQAETRRAKDRERKRNPRNSMESTETAEFQEQGSPLEVAPQTPLPKTPSKIAPLSPPKSKSRKAVSIQVPEWVPAEPWLAFVAMRVGMERDSKGKIQWSEAAAKGVIAKIDRLRGEGHDPAKLLEKAVVSSWRTVVPDEDTKGGAGKREVSPADLRKTAELFDRMGKREEAAEYRQRAALAEQRAAA